MNPCQREAAAADPFGQLPKRMVPRAPSPEVEEAAWRFREREHAYSARAPSRGRPCRPNWSNLTEVARGRGRAESWGPRTSDGARCRRRAPSTRQSRRRTHRQGLCGLPAGHWSSVTLRWAAECQRGARTASGRRDEARRCELRVRSPAERMRTERRVRHEASGTRLPSCAVT